MEIKNDKGEVQEEGTIFESETCEIQEAKTTLKDKFRWKIQDYKYKYLYPQIYHNYPNAYNEAQYL